MQYLLRVVRKLLKFINLSIILSKKDLMSAFKNIMRKTEQTNKI